MVNPSRIQKEQKTFNLILETYNKEISGVSSSWKGSSYNNLKSEASSFIGKANKISSYFSSYARAASLYQEYKDQKQIHREYLHKYNNADELNPQRLYYKKRKEHAYEKMNDLKKQIRTQLKSIGSVVCSDIGNPTEIQLKLDNSKELIDSMIEIALGELGMTDANSAKYDGIGGQAWCSAFVSWVARQNDIPDDVIPKTNYCPDGVTAFKEMGRFKNNDGKYTPKRGDIIYFDPDHNGNANHVGIVKDCKEGVVHTIEGNTSDMCAEREYSIDDSRIYGYGVPDYSKVKNY